jgi:branched-subunit amino acid aminotransferase/4-amino-4-deoxychorismate lyase
MADLLSPSQKPCNESQSFLPAPKTGWVSTSSIPLSDRGFRYGMHLFESFALMFGHPEFLDAHLLRLESSVQLRRYQPPPNWLSAIRDLLTQTRTEPSLFGRVYVTAGDGSPSEPPTQARVFITLEPRARLLPESYALAPVDCPSHDVDQPASGFLKSGHYSIRCNALQKARDNGADEALLVHPVHGPLSASMANFFWKLNGRWHTTPLGPSVRNGVWREWWIRQIHASESHLAPHEIPNIESASLTSSWIGVMPVHRIGETVIPERGHRISAEPRPINT